MADEVLGTGTLSKRIPKDYPVSPDIIDRRNEHPAPPAGFSAMPEIVIKSQPADYQVARNKRKQQ